MSNFLIDPFSFAAAAPTAFDVSISADADDGHDSNGVWAGGGTTATVGFSISVFDAGFRFVLTIAAGSTITAGATLELNVLSRTASGGVTLLHGLRANDAGTWNGVGPATMSVTTASVGRTLGTVQLESFDVTAILQEIVDNHSGIGGHVSFGLLDNGSAAFNSSGIETRENAGVVPARLVGSFT